MGVCKEGKQVLNRRLLYRITEFIHTEAASGAVLFIATLVAVAWANSPFAGSYQALWHTSIAGLSALHWVNDALMSVFFLVVGLEIKRELSEGELSTLAQATLPVVAALGGMIIPAMIYLALNIGTEGAPGWGIPMATDIAFAVGVLTLLGKRVPPALKVFLLALAIVDDIGAILVIAAVYTNELHWSFLLMGLGLLGTLLILNLSGVRRVAVYLLAGIILWFCLYKSGVHATVAGVLLAAVIPSTTGHRLIRSLHPWIAFTIMPIFALANAGVSITGNDLLSRVGSGVILGLVVGKQLGITVFSWVAVRLRLAALPDLISWSQLYGVACLGGIGFTMSIFISNLALENALIYGAKTAVLVASVLSACLGVFILSRGKRQNGA